MLVPSHTLLPRGDINQLFNTHHEYDYAQVTDILQFGSIQSSGSAVQCGAVQ